MSYSFRRPATAGLMSFCAALTLAAAFSPAADVPDSRWDAPATYYTSVGTGSTQLQGVALRTQLDSIVTNGMVNQSYDANKLSMPITDRVYGTTAAQKQMWGVYDRKVLNGVWDSAATWNREHVWPQSKLGGNSDHDMFGLRPAFVQSNGDRANYGYGGANITDGTAAGNLPKNPGATYPLFYAGQYDKGDVARACFYMATRYYVASNPNSTSSLKIVNTTDGYNPDGTMGDLNSMLHWHYQDPVDNFERRRNSMIYNNTENSSLSQRNRNPYVDHPEYVWSVFGDGANDSQITLAAPTAVAADGTSTKAVNFGRVITGSAAPTLSTTVTVGKAGADPTTFNVTTSGSATTDSLGNLNTFTYGNTTKAMTVGLSGVNTNTAGVKSGRVSIDNTDITNQGAGTGALDGDDNVDLSLTVVDHSNASFAATSDEDTLVVNFQDIDRGQSGTKAFSLNNLVAASGFTAGLDLDSITGTGDTDAFNMTMAQFAALEAGTSRTFDATFTPDHNGTFYAVYTLGVSDENIAGATNGSALTLILTGVGSAFTQGVPEPAVLVFAPMLTLVLRRRRSA